jgi:hypothetical protein
LIGGAGRLDEEIEVVGGNGTNVHHCSPPAAVR